MSRHAMSVIRVAVLAVGMSATAAGAAVQKEVSSCAALQESDKRLACFDALAQRVGTEPTTRADGCKESVLARIGGGLFRSFPRQRELW